MAWLALRGSGRMVVVLAAAVSLLVLLYVARIRTSRPALVSLRQLLDAGVAAAEAGGDEVRRVRLTNRLAQQSKGKTREGADDPLTAGDLSSHRVMYGGLSASFPGLSIISEEHTQGDRDAATNLQSRARTLGGLIKDDVLVPAEAITVWIDPLDATQEYTENLLDYVTTMVCVAVHGSPVIGVIHQPFLNKTTWGWVGHGSNVHSPAQGDATETRTVVVSRSHPGEVQALAKKAFGPEVKVVPAGGAGYKVLQLVEGHADAYLHSSAIKKWDVCAGNALLASLGGHMTALDGTPLSYSIEATPVHLGGLLAALSNHGQMLDSVRKARAKA
ncbi:inositol monophosphatase 3-like [Dermacentor variabilis]|uniref:inositol monophosphatase 3-like n=1 Tax=Dermacentor variabilis TaxID=34621 RepID=UPI003F5C9C74